MTIKEGGGVYEGQSVQYLSCRVRNSLERERDPDMADIRTQMGSLGGGNGQGGGGNGRFE
jgi:hypothetical protein